MQTIAQKYYAAIKQGAVRRVEIASPNLQQRSQRKPRCGGRLDAAASTSWFALGGGKVNALYWRDSSPVESKIKAQFTSSRSRSSRARLSIARIFSAAGFEMLGTDMASSQESSMAVRVSLISLCICAATARRAVPSSPLRRCKAERASRTRRSMPVTPKLT